MAQLPVITTPRAMITPFTEEYITPRYIEWLNDPETVKYSQQRLRHHDEQSCLQFLQGFTNSPHHFSAVTTPDHGHIGNISTTIDAHNKTADIAILIGHKIIWGQGYGTEIWGAIIESLFTEGMRLVTGGCMANNAGMIKIMEKTNMALYYTRKNFFLYEGRPVDSLHYVAQNTMEQGA